MKIFRCHHCTKACPTKEELMIHKRQHTQTKSFECEVCEEAFMLAEQLRIHQAAAHSAKASGSRKSHLDDKERDSSQGRRRLTRASHAKMEMNKQSPSENCNGRQLRSRAKPTTSSVDGENFLTDTTALSDSEDDVPLSLRRTRDVSTSSLDSFKSLVPDDPVNEEPQVQATTSSHRRPCPGENQEAFTSISSAETQSDSEDDILLSLRLRRSSKGSQRDSLPGSSCGTKSTPTSRQSRRSRRRSPVEVDYEEDGDTESGSSSSHPSSGWSTERRSSLPRHCKTTSRMRLRNLSEEDDISRRLRPRTPRKENANSRYPLRSHAAKKSDQSLGRHQMPIQSQDRKAYFDPKLESPLKVCLKRSTFPVECSSYGGDRVGSDVEDDAPLSDRRRARRNSTNSSSGPVKVQIDGHWFLLHQASDNPLVWKATEMNDSAI